MNIKEFICAIQNRPQMYVEEIKLDYIYYLVIGFWGSNLMNKGVSNIDQMYKSHFSNWILDWVKKNVNENYERSNFFWYHILRDVTDNEDEAVQLFFKLSNMFFEEVEARR